MYVNKCVSVRVCVIAWEYTFIGACGRDCMNMFIQPVLRYMCVREEAFIRASLLHAKSLLFCSGLCLCVYTTIMKRGCWQI